MDRGNEWLVHISAQRQSETEHSLDPETGSEDSSDNLHIAQASSSAVKSLLMSLKDTKLLNDPVLFQPHP